MAGDHVQRQRGLVVVVEIGPVHGDQDVLALADLMRRPPGKLSHTSMPLLLSIRSICWIACLVTKPFAKASA